MLEMNISQNYEEKMKTVIYQKVLDVKMSLNRFS